MSNNNTLQSVNEFCKTNSISRSLFYKLQRQGNGPKVMKVGRRTLITPEASQEWRKRMQEVARLLTP